MEQICKNCSQQFLIDQRDREFYQKIAPEFNGKKFPVNPPTHCPKCRVQRRHAWRNEFNLHKRKCDLCAKAIISIYPDRVPFPVYCNDCWWSDKWDPTDYKMDYDSAKPFFDQLFELQQKVPRMAIYNKNAENSEYTNHSSNLKDSYMSSCTVYSENIYHSRWIIKCKDLCDCYEVVNCELSYECLYSDGAYQNIHGYFADSQFCSFVYDCRSCTNCFMCHNLRNKQYCIENKQYSKEDYKRIMAGINLGSYKQFQKYYNQYLDMIANKSIKQNIKYSFSEDCTGELQYKCKNVHDSHGTVSSEDCRYCHESEGMKDCYDVCESATNCELQYETNGCDRGVQIIAGNISYDVNNCNYVDSCHSSSNLFGCVGLRQKQYHILNKPYSKEEYNDLAARIATHMTENQEWGEYFPMQNSPFPYNQSHAFEDFPITQDRAQSNNLKWKEKEQKDYQPQTCQVPDDIKDTPDSITGEVLACIDCGMNYKIVQPELEFYRKLTLPIPRKCPTCRRLERKKLRPPLFKLTQKECHNCSNLTTTSYHPEFPGKVYCDKCYFEAVY